jgi:hypothetical protein
LRACGVSGGVGSSWRSRRVDEKELFLDTKSGWLAIVKALIRPVGDLTTGRIRAVSLSVVDFGFEVGGSGLPIVLQP